MLAVLHRGLVRAAAARRQRAAVPAMQLSAAAQRPPAPPASWLDQTASVRSLCRLRSLTTALSTGVMDLIVDGAHIRALSVRRNRLDQFSRQSSSPGHSRARPATTPEISTTIDLGIPTY